MTKVKTPKERAWELFPPKYIAETWVRQEPDRNAPLRAAYVKGFQEGYFLALDIVRQQQSNL